MTKHLIQTAKSLSNDFLKFVNSSPSPYHAVKEAGQRLKCAGFEAVGEEEDWSARIEKGGKYMVTRGGSSLVAFACGENFKPQSSYFKIVGTHTDSPCLRLAPNSKLDSCGYQLGAVQTYGGGLWHTWLDRDLELAGRVLVRTARGLEQRLYRSAGAVGSLQ